MSVLLAIWKHFKSMVKVKRSINGSLHYVYMPFTIGTIPYDTGLEAPVGVYLLLVVLEVPKRHLIYHMFPNFMVCQVVCL